MMTILAVVGLFWARVTGAEAMPEVVALYVATNGNDAWSGSLPAPNADGTDGPHATLTRARDAIRELKAAGPLKQPVTVMIRGGTYYLAQPLSFGPEDSGSADCPITYAAYQAERPVLSGGRVITGWQPYRDKIVQCSLPEVKAGRWRFRQLFFRGQRQVRSRWPNRDSEDPLYGGWGFIEAEIADGDKRPAAFRWQPDTEPRHWASPAQAEVMVFPWRCWVNDLIPVKQVDRAKRLLNLGREALPAWMPVTKGNRFRVENVLEELDEPGEWCLDTEAGTLFFWPPADTIDSGEVLAPVTDRLVELVGRPDKPVHHVRISGLTFTCTLSAWPEQRHPNFHAPVLRGEALRLQNAEHCSVTRNLVSEVGGDGIRLQDACSHNVIENNEIAYTGGQGVSFSSTNSTGNGYCGRDLKRLKQQAAEKSRMVRNTVSNNHIHHCGIIEKHGAGVLVWGINSVDNVISHNLIHHVAHSGLTAQDGFGRLIIEYNEMHDLCLEIADCGGIFTNRWLIVDDDKDLVNGNLIRHNLIRDAIGCGAYTSPAQPMAAGARRADGRIWTPYYTWGIYFDNSAIGVTVYGNICAGNTLGGISMPVGHPRNNLVENNIFAGSSIRQMDLKVSGSGNRFIRNIVYYDHPTAALLNTGGGGVRQCDYNVYFHTGGKKLRVKGVAGESLDAWRKKGHDTHSVVADPLFVDPDGGDFRLKPESPALELGFKPLPVDRIGLETNQVGLP